VIGFLAAYRRRNRCGEHQGSLLDFAARRAGGPEVRRALDHVERCERCARDLAATTLILHALRRIHDETLAVQPAGDGWERLRGRLEERRRRPSRLVSGMPGALAGLAICALLVGPATLGTTTTVFVDDGRPSEPRVPTPVLPVAPVDAGARPVAADDLFRSLAGVRESAAARATRPATGGGPAALTMTVDRR
jgi:hypothetical protein